MWGQVDVRNRNLISPSQVDNDLLEFHPVSDGAGWYRVLDALTGVDNPTSASVVSCATAISVPKNSFETFDLWRGLLLADLRFLYQNHVNPVALQYVCYLVEFCGQEITISL